MSLRIVKLAHTVIWAFFVACILGVPIAATSGRFDWAAGLAFVVVLEVVVLLLNRWSCPLTAVAARYTEERAPNFDIYRPRWLAQHNKVIFGSLYLVGVAYALPKWAIA